ncbi:MAG: hypothetical protein CVV11_19825 [Gammaproteobacteria bacterium HGW-Gammaproteobacteria-15]|nr:MAG: hypothetical protein CVV11_19825 [Gammaproteobacteria bacterium HGW-Gammaproteobacteria-15]
MSIKQKFIDLVLRGRDLFSKDAGTVNESLKALQAESKAASEEFKALEKSQAAIAQARGLELYADQAEKALAAARNEVTRLAKEIDANRKSTKELSENFSEAKKTANQAEKALAAASKEVKKLSGEMDSSGKSTKQQSANLEAAKNSANKAELALQAAREEVTRLAREIDASDKPTKEQAEALKLAGRSANQLQAEYNKLSGQLSRAKGDLQQAGVNTDKLADEQTRLQKEIKESAAGLSEKRAKLRELSSELKNSETRTNAFAGKLSGLTSRLLAFGAAYIGLNQVRSALTGIFTAGDKFEKLDIQLAGVMGSIEAGEQASAWIKDFAKNTPLQLDQVTETFVRLKNFGLDPMGGIMQSIIDQSEKLGGGYERVQGISLALGQAWAKQKLQGEEILQLIERGVPVWQLLENVTGKNTAELQKLSSAGKLGRDVMKKLIDEIGRSAEGQAQKGMSTLTGLISNAKDNLDQFYNLIANSGAMDFLKAQLRAVNESFAEMSKNGELQKLAKSISDNIVSAAQSVKSFIVTLYEWRTAIGTVAAVWATLKVGSFFKDLVVGSAQAVVSLYSLITTKKIAASANAVYAASLGPVIARLAAARAATAAWMASLTGTAALLSKAGIFGGIAYGVYEIGRLATAWWDLRTAQKALAESQAEASITNSATLSELEKINLQLGTNYKTTQELFAAQDAGQISLNNLTGAWQLNTAEVDKNKGSLADYQKVWSTTADGIKAAYETLGITSTAALKDTAKAAEDAFKIIQQGNEPIEQQRLAFMKWAEAALAAARATGAAVPEQLRARSATLGLSAALDDLIKKQGVSAETAIEQSRGSAVYRAEIEKTLQSIRRYNEILKGATFSEREKAAAAKGLAEAQSLLTLQQEDQIRVNELSNKSYFEITLALEEAQRKSDELTRSYRSGTITADQYSAATARLIALIKALRELQGQAGDSSADMSNKQADAGKKTDKTTESVKKQASELKSLTENTEKTTTATSLLASAQLYMRKEFDFSSTSTEELGKRHRELTDFIRQNQRVQNEWWRELALASNQGFTREQQIISETLKIREYTQTLASSSVTMEQVRRIQSTLNYGFAQLGDNDLEPLRNAIADAERRILSLRDNLQGTVSSLQDELDALRDNQDAIEKRRYEQQIAELQAQLNQAQSSGDQQSVKAAQEALRLAKEIYAIKTAQIKQDKEAAKNTGSSNNNTASPAPTTNTTPNRSSSAADTVRVEIALPSGRVVTTQASRSDAASLMAELEQIRSTSL